MKLHLKCHSLHTNDAEWSFSNPNIINILKQYLSIYILKPNSVTYNKETHIHGSLANLKFFETSVKLHALLIKIKVIDFGIGFKDIEYSD